MKKIIPFNKELNFKTNLAEITSIALDHNLELFEHNVKGNLTISGSYKINDTSVNTEEFNFEIPVNIEISDKYNLDKLKINIDDFYYEIINNSILNVNISVLLDNLEEVFKQTEIIEPVNIENKNIENTNTENRNIENVKSLFENIDDNETYVTYKVCILNETDTVESITTKYNITREILEKYNDLSDLKIGDKLIIPFIFNESN